MISTICSSHLHRRSHDTDGVIEGGLLALREQLAVAVARQREKLVIRETSVAADLRTEVDAVLTTDHLCALEFHQVLQPLVDRPSLPHRLLELAHAAHHLGPMGPHLNRLDPAPMGRRTTGHLLHAPAHEPVDEFHRGA